MEWIRDTRAEAPESKPSKHSKHSLQSKQVKQVKQETPRTEPRSLAPIKQGLRQGWTRATFIVRDEHLEKVRALAYWDRREIKEVIDEALGAYLKGKNIKPRKEGV